MAPLYGFRLERRGMGIPGGPTALLSRRHAWPVPNAQSTRVVGLSCSQLSEARCGEVSNARLVLLAHLGLEAHRAHHGRLALAWSGLGLGLGLGFGFGLGLGLRLRLRLGSG